VSPPEPPFRCADAARDRADPLVGSAPQARRWLLIEHPGPWRIDAVLGSGIAASVLEVLISNAQRSLTRILLVRRPGRHARTPERAWILASLDAPTRRGRWRADEDLLGAAEEMTRDDARWTAGQEPILLVCTHGVHDTCCALRGRPVAAALAEQWPDAVWECSHIGGDRFAPNDVVGQHLAGTVPSTHLRGMARYSPPVQVAVAAAYERCAPLAPRDVTVRKVDRDGPHDGHGSQTTVELDIAGRLDPLQVEVLSVRRPAAELTCRAGRATPATEYRVQAFG
jgi:sucrase/ferredoxin-like protein